MQLALINREDGSESSAFMLEKDERSKLEEVGVHELRWIGGNKDVETKVVVKITVKKRPNG